MTNKLICSSSTQAIQESLWVMYTYVKEPWPELFCHTHQLYVLVWPFFCSMSAIATLAVNSIKSLLCSLSQSPLSLCTRCSVLSCLISKSLSRHKKCFLFCFSITTVQIFCLGTVFIIAIVWMRKTTRDTMRNDLCFVFWNKISY